MGCDKNDIRVCLCRQGCLKRQKCDVLPLQHFSSLKFVEKREMVEVEKKVQTLSFY